MQVNDKVVCVYAGKYMESGHLTTHGTYTVLATQFDHGREYIVIQDNSGASRTYTAQRFVNMENI